jgi:quinoprotein glucose dehydrogenase
MSTLRQEHPGERGKLVPSRRRLKSHAPLCRAFAALAAGTAVALSGARPAGAALIPAARIAALSANQLASDARTDWYTYGGAFSNRRYSPLAEINRSTIGRVKTLIRIRGGRGVKR